MGLDGFEQLLDDYGTEVLRFIRFYTRDGNEAEDLTQEVFLRVFKSRQDLSVIENRKAWLLRIAVNLCRDHHRRQRRHPEAPAGRMVDGSTSIVDRDRSAPSAEEMVLHNESMQQVLEQVLSLPTKYKELLVLRYFEEMSMEEIAWTTGLSVSTVKSRLHRARTLMRRGEEDVFDGPQR